MLDWTLILKHRYLITRSLRNRVSERKPTSWWSSHTEGKFISFCKNDLSKSRREKIKVFNCVWNCVWKKVSAWDTQMMKTFLVRKVATFLLLMHLHWLATSFPWYSTRDDVIMTVRVEEMMMKLLELEKEDYNERLQCNESVKTRHQENGNQVFTFFSWHFFLYEHAMMSMMRYYYYALDSMRVLSWKRTTVDQMMVMIMLLTVFMMSFPPFLVQFESTHL